jgi:hypothetical protein
LEIVDTNPFLKAFVDSNFVGFAFELPLFEVFPKMVALQSLSSVL